MLGKEQPKTQASNRLIVKVCLGRNNQKHKPAIDYLLKYAWEGITKNISQQ